MGIDLTDEEAAALAKELDAIIRNDRYPLSPRIQNAENNPREVATGAGTRAIAAAQGVRTAIKGPMATPPLKSYTGPPMTLGNAAAARARLIVIEWYRLRAGNRIRSPEGEACR